MKAYTDIEQSKKLTEILPLESADFVWLIGHFHTDGPRYEVIRRKDEVSEPENYWPCWSLAALMNLLPSEFTEKGKYSETTYKIDIRKYALTNDVDLYQIAYGNYKWHEDGSHTWSDMVNSGEKEELIDAVFQMICWLKENNKI